MTEPVVHTKPGAKSKGTLVKCDECGHEWYSRGKGRYYRCPKCYERETGKKLGSYFIETKGNRLKITPEKKNQSVTPDKKPGIKPEQDPPEAKPNDKPAGGGLKGIFNNPLFRI